MVTITFKASPEEKAAYLEAAKIAGLPISSWIRQTLTKSMIMEVALELNAKELTQEDTRTYNLSAKDTDRDVVTVDPPPKRHFHTLPSKYKFSPECNRCHRIGVPSCNPCRKLNGIREIE